MISADTLVLLSDIDGLYTGDPRSDKAATHIPEIREITAEIEAMAGTAASGLSNGGMVTKLIAGRIAMAAGCRMAIADGRQVGALGALIDGKARCSWFIPDASPLSARKRWIKGSLKSSGTIEVDDGAVRALSAGRACCRPASPGSTASSSAATWSRCATARAASWPVVWSPTLPRMPAASPATRARKSRNCWAFAVATRWSTATTSWSSEYTGVRYERSEQTC
jgi:hypothetical protein